MNIPIPLLVAILLLCIALTAYNIVHIRRDLSIIREAASSIEATLNRILKEVTSKRE